MQMTKSRKVAEMALEYRFDYEKAKPNRFAEKLKLNAGWTVEKFMAEEKKEKPKALRSAPAKKVKPVKKSSAKKVSKSVAKKKKK